jgi:uncharacterized protein (TIGR03084 family)
MSDVLGGVLADLAAEGDRLESLVSGLDEAGWRTPTPAVGWDVATQVAHLAWTDDAAFAAATDKQAWDALVLEAIADPEHAVDTAAVTGGAVSPDRLLDRWRAGRVRLAHVLRAYPAGQKMPWYGPPMSPTSMATARLMETWAHSLDVHEALGVAPEVDDRIRHIAHLGVRTRRFSFAARGETAPEAEPRVTLTAPSGDVWTWGPDETDGSGEGETVTGPAYDFCLLVTQRVHRADTALVATGRGADRWLDVAQCFAGPPGGGRSARG